MGYVPNDRSVVAYNDRGHVSVDPDRMRRYAEDGIKRTMEFAHLVDRMKDLMSQTYGFWEGDTADTYRATFDREIRALWEAFEEFRMYPFELIDYADYYDDVAHDAKAIAEQVERATWADPRMW